MLLAKYPRAKQFHRIIPQYFTSGLVSNRLRIEFRQRFRRFYGVRVRVIGIPDNVLTLQVVDHIFKRPLIAVTGNDA